MFFDGAGDGKFPVPRYFCGRPNEPVQLAFVVQMGIPYTPEFAIFLQNSGRCLEEFQRNIWIHRIPNVEWGIQEDELLRFVIES